MTHSISRNEHRMSSNPHFQVRESPPLSSHLASSSLAASHIVASVNRLEKRKNCFRWEYFCVFLAPHRRRRCRDGKMTRETFKFKSSRRWKCSFSFHSLIRRCDFLGRGWTCTSLGDRQIEKKFNLMKKNSKKSETKNEKYFDVREETLRLWKRKIKVWEKRIKKSTQEASEKRKFLRYFSLVRQ